MQLGLGYCQGEVGVRVLLGLGFALGTVGWVHEIGCDMFMCVCVRTTLGLGLGYIICVILGWGCMG